MKKFLVLALMSVLASAAACGQRSELSAISEQSDLSDSGENSYVLLDEDLQQLKDDFNANEGRVRLMFLSGPTCGICLRGMADLNDEFIAASQNDDRLVTFVVHVPALGAREEHVADTIPLLNGPRVHHYWEESGIIGSHYTDVMEVDMYVWDFWMIYGPEARWQGTLPPKPDYYEHQLGGFPREKMLDAERFAAEASKYVDRVDSSRFAKQADLEVSESELFADGTIIPVVAQPRNVAVRQHIMGRGGYKNLKRIQSISKRGRWLIDGDDYPLRIDMTRPNLIIRTIFAGDQELVSEVRADGSIAQSERSTISLPDELERMLLNAYEFDGLFVEWPDKGSELAMVGMLKIDEVLAWRLDLTQSGGQHWNLYVDSHGGAIVKAELLGDDDQVEYTILQSDIRETDGFKYPHRIEYLANNGRTLAVEVIEEIEIEQAPFVLADESVTH